MQDPEIIIIPIVIGIPALVAFVRMSYRHKERMAAIQGASPERRADVEDRLERIEQAVDTLAVEMERIGEGQRFVTKLLAERPSPQQIEPRAPQRERATTPH